MTPSLCGEQRLHIHTEQLVTVGGGGGGGGGGGEGGCDDKEIVPMMRRKGDIACLFHWDLHVE